MSNIKKVWTISELLNWTKQYFGEKGVDNPRLDAEVLLSHILKKDRMYLYVHFDQPLEDNELKVFREMVKKRVARIPVAYILGYREFMGLDFAVTPAVLIPRPDTEILVEAALKRLQIIAKPNILDLGTGSGAVCVSLLANIPEASAVTVDISNEALTVAKSNAEKYGVADRLTFLHGNLFEPINKEKFTAIVSNPPYIPNEDIAGLEPEVRREPQLALAGGMDGLDFYRRIIKNGSEYLMPGGFIAVEVGIHQAQAVAAMAQQSDFIVSEIVKDYSGIERVVILELKAGK